MTRSSREAGSVYMLTCSGNCWPSRIVSSRSTSTRQSPTSYAVYSECTFTHPTSQARRRKEQARRHNVSEEKCLVDMWIAHRMITLGSLRHERFANTQQRSGQDMELRDADGPEDVRSDGCAGAMRSLHCAEELGERTPRASDQAHY